MKFDLEEIWSQIYDSRHSPLEDRIRLLDGLLACLQEEVDARPSAEIFYAIGYLCYVYPKKSDVMQKKVLASFFKAIELDPTFGSPKLHLGHYYYDIGDYQTALVYFGEAAKATWSDYYSAVIQEMILCCELSLDGVKSALPQLEVFVSRCLSVDENDVFPDQLFKCFVRVAARAHDVDALRSAIGLLDKLVRGIHQESVFHKDLARLQEMLVS